MKTTTVPCSTVMDVHMPPPVVCTAVVVPLDMICNHAPYAFGHLLFQWKSGKRICSRFMPVASSLYERN